jgi:DNA-binding response OmpR family regulator
MTTEAVTKILVIEDEPKIVRVISETLVDMPYELSSAPDGPSGLASFRDRKPALVLLDLALPRMDGWEVLAAIRRSEEPGSHTPVVIVTAHGDSATAVEARDRGADGFLAKPFQPGDLRRVVEAQLGAGVNRGV